MRARCESLGCIAEIVQLCAWVSHCARGRAGVSGQSEPVRFNFIELEHPRTGASVHYSLHLDNTLTSDRSDVSLLLLVDAVRLNLQRSVAARSVSQAPGVRLVCLRPVSTIISELLRARTHNLLARETAMNLTALPPLRYLASMRSATTPLPAHIAYAGGPYKACLARVLLADWTPTESQTPTRPVHVEPTRWAQFGRQLAGKACVCAARPGVLLEGCLFRGQHASWLVGDLLVAGAHAFDAPAFRPTLQLACSA